MSFNAAMRDALRMLYGRAPDAAQTKTPLAGGAMETKTMLTRTVAKIAAKDNDANPAFDIPLYKKYGVIDLHVTPEIAQHWLRFNTANREITNAKLEQFKQDMERGEWTDCGDPVRFSPGKLVDGQHRLMACTLTNTSFRAVVVFGIDPEAQVNMDTGRSRTPRDVLSIEGLDKWSAATLGAAIHSIIAHHRGLGIYSIHKYINRDVRNFYLENKMAMLVSMQVIHDLPRKHPVVPHAKMFSLHYLLAQRNPALATDFVTKLATGDGIPRTSPIYLLRQKLISDMIGKTYEPNYRLFCYLVKTWNAWRKGNHPKGITYMRPRDGEAFPEIEQ